MVMKRSFRDNWSKALRSGEFEQGKGLLCMTYPGLGKTYCCLGVRCELDVREGKMTKEDSSLGVAYNGVRTVYSELNLPHSVSSGMLDSNTLLRWGLPESVHSHLIQMNDDKNRTFENIAAFLDRLPVEED